MDGDGCDDGCQVEYCGDGALQQDGIDGIAGNADDEQCDDGNTNDADGCSATCKLEACGNGTVDIYEACDDGNLDDGDGCDDSCQFEYCGDGALNATGVVDSL